MAKRWWFVFGFLLLAQASQAQFWMKYLPTPGTNKPETTVSGISRDGSVVVGQTATASGLQACIWALGHTTLNLLGKNFFPYGANLNGSILSGSGQDTAHHIADQGCRLTGRLMEFAGSFAAYPNNDSDGFGISSDGTILVGESEDYQGDGNYLPYKALNGGHLQLLPGGQYGGEAEAVSDDDSTIVGSAAHNAISQWFPCYWDSKGIHFLPVPLAPTVGVATCVSQNGQTIAGFIGVKGVRSAFIWTRAHGTVVLPFYNATARAISANGEVVVGPYSAKSGVSAFLYTPWTGQLDFSTYMKANHIVLPALGDVAGMSAAGTRMVANTVSTTALSQGILISYMIPTSGLLKGITMPASIAGGSSGTGRVYLAAPAFEPVTVDLTSSSLYVTTPPYLHIPVGGVPLPFRFRPSRSTCRSRQRFTRGLGEPRVR